MKVKSFVDHITEVWCGKCNLLTQNPCRRVGKGRVFLSRSHQSAGGPLWTIIPEDTVLPFCKQCDEYFVSYDFVKYLRTLPPEYTISEKDPPRQCCCVCEIDARGQLTHGMCDKCLAKYEEHRSVGKCPVQWVADETRRIIWERVNREFLERNRHQ